MASVIHGFIYNKDMFEELGVTDRCRRPMKSSTRCSTRSQTDGRYTPLAMGTNDLWESATMGFQNIGPNYWKGEEGRLALIDGTGKFTDQAYVDTLAGARPLGAVPARRLRGHRLPGCAAALRDRPGSDLPGRLVGHRVLREPGRATSASSGRRWPNAGDTCYISDHTDIALGHERRDDHPDEARTFLDWVAGDEFAIALLQRAARLLLAVERPGHARGSGRPGSGRPAARRASRRSATRTRSSRAASRTWRTSCGVSAPRSSTAR